MVSVILKRNNRNNFLNEWGYETINKIICFYLIFIFFFFQKKWFIKKSPTINIHNFSIVINSLKSQGLAQIWI